MEREEMKQEFKEWAKTKVQVAWDENHQPINELPALLWSAWQTAWRLSSQSHMEEIKVLKETLQDLKYQLIKKEEK